MRIHREMTFIGFREGKAAFIGEDGIERSFKLPSGEFHRSAADAVRNIEGMKAGRVYELEVTEGVITEVAWEGHREEGSGRREARKKYLAYKMNRGTLSASEFQEALSLGIREPKRDMSWVFIGISGVLLTSLLDFTVGLTLFTGLSLTRMIWGEVTE